MTECSVEGCADRAHARGWCMYHYNRWKRHGDPLSVPVRIRLRCRYPGCRAFPRKRGLCTSHDYFVNRKQGRPPRDRRTEFEKRVQVTESCWLWIGPQSPLGYGMFNFGRTHLQAHRVSYELHKGPIPDGLVLDHLCRTPACVNPDHLEPVTHRENILRGVGPPAQNARKTHCIHGHPLSGENLLVRPNGTRSCRECGRIRNRAFELRRRLQATGEAS